MTRLEQLRFNRLVRHFVHRFVDNELIAAGGEVHQTFVTAVAIVLGGGFTLALVLAVRYFFMYSRLSADTMRWLVLSDQLLMILLVMALTGLFTVLGWDALFPDRRDSFILGSLPLRTRTIFQAKLYAILLFFCLILAAMQICPLLVSPAMFPQQIIRGFIAQALTLSAAAAFVFFGAMALQGLMLALLSYGRFQQLSSALQISTLVGCLSLIFLTPSPALASLRRFDWVQWLPPYWFLSLWQDLLGRPQPMGLHLSSHALIGTAAAIAVAILSFVSGYQSAMRKALEGQPLPRSGPGILIRSARWLLDRLFLRDPRERAVFYFGARTMARHRNHRLLLSVYAGLGLAWVLSDVSNIVAQGLSSKALAPNPITCTIPLDLAFFLMAGMRALFGLPVELRANWLFRISAGERSNAVQRGVRKLMVVLGILPMALLPLPFYLLAWGWKSTLIHTWIYTIESWLILEIMLARFRKIPFTCSWLPGKGNLKVKLGCYWILFGGISSMFGAAETEFLTHNSPKQFLFFSGLLLAGLAWTLRNRHEAQKEPWNFIFEERSEAAAMSMQLIR